MKEFIKELTNLEGAYDVFNRQGIIYIAGMLLSLFIAKKVYDFCTPYKLDEQLTEKDNKAVAISFAGYLLGVSIILWGVLSSTSKYNLESESFDIRLIMSDLGNTLLWSFIGILLLQMSRYINDKIILRRFCNMRELIEDRNMGVGAAEAGTCIGSGLIVMASVSGEDANSFGHSLVATLIYFFATQLLFVVFAILQAKISRYDLHKEMENDNAAAGISFGLNLVAIGILLSGYITRYDSLAGLAIWFVISCVLLIACRFIVDKFILPGAELDYEIEHDKNWGASLIEGGCAIGLALLCVAAF